ncbi:opine dehydrogenase [Ensifer sp. YR511]|nr:opine dehydrogenase [Ensifer sp. YR511]
MAVYMTRRGHTVGIWSRSFDPTRDTLPGPLKLTATGVVDGSFEVKKLQRLTELEGYPIVIIALPATAYFDVLPDLAMHLTSQQIVIFSGSLSLAPLWLHEMARYAGNDPTITAWGTTLLAGSFQQGGTLHIPFVRKKFDLASLPCFETANSLDLCKKLFGIEFQALSSVLDVSLSNINPIAHAGQMIGNFSRIDKAEKWKLFENFTPSGVQLANALDAERLKIAQAYGAQVRSLQRHYALSYAVDEADVATMVKEIDRTGSRTLGPATLNHRYLVEDMPYGLAFLERLASRASIDVPVLSSVLSILEVMCKLDIRGGNRILDLVIGARDDKQSIIERCQGTRTPDLTRALVE